MMSQVRPSAFLRSPTDEYFGYRRLASAVILKAVKSVRTLADSTDPKDRAEYEDARAFLERGASPFAEALEFDPETLRNVLSG